MGKAPHRSKTILFNLGCVLLVGLLKRWVPGIEEAICGRADLLIMIMATVNLLLRYATKEGITAIVALSMLAGCSTMHQALDPKVFYKRDCGVEVNGQLFEGVVVVPDAPAYSFVLTPKGNIDLMLIQTCHRTFSVEKISPGWFSKNKYQYNFTPIAGLETGRVCPTRIQVFESSKEGRHSWAFLDRESPDYTVQATLSCDGTTRRINGVGACQAKQQTVQRLTFSEPVRFAPPEPPQCNRPVQRGNDYEFAVSPGECLYHFDTQDRRKGRLTLIGYDGVLIREGQ